MIHFDMPELRQMWFILGQNNQEPTKEMVKQYNALDHYKKEQLIQAREQGKQLQADSLTSEGYKVNHV